MIRTALDSRPVRAGAALTAAAGIALLAGCAPVASEAEEPGTADTGSSGSSDTGSTGGSGSGSYADGTYTAEGSYATPESVEQISVTVTLEGDVITAVEVTGDPQKRESEQYQSQFIGGIADVVVGQDIDEIQVSRVAGSSLTSNGFNEAIETIKSEAAN
ncbi:FMN-binding protein [Microbacterium sp. M3]|uniref:FMN-binding protein n=1 Tax=Microbacterium arthrosphaerae TaxID=792652 RepID=A0ABU4GW37_9MICO|nr:MULTISPECIES: FMN-binding protein [Microbacterium]MDW4571276.1 FMN-binding protein [Microbacterium arthrosphaerae]MDW7605131.1 FMN-binding protein [Microbacterium sp. M3]